MASHRSTVRTRCPLKPGWQDASTAARHLQRSFLELADRRSMEGLSKRLSFIPDVSLAVPVVSAGRRRRARLASSRGRSARTRPHEYPGDLHRPDVPFCKRNGLSVGKTTRGTGTTITAVADADSLPIAMWNERTSPHELTLVARNINPIFLRQAPNRLIGDRAYGGRPFDDKLLRESGVEPFAPHHSNHRRPTAHIVRILRRYRRRRKVERLFAWFHHFRRIATRYEHYPLSFLRVLYVGLAHYSVPAILRAVLGTLITIAFSILRIGTEPAPAAI